jgi:hypothetical protein
MSRLRRAGSPWRILVHDYVGGDLCYGKAHDITNHPAAYRGGLEPEMARRADATRQAAEQAGLSETIILPRTEFDELVVGHWIHLEQMNTSQWWMSIGGVTVWVTADRDGHPKQVSVFGPNDYDGPVDGCAYELKWTELTPPVRPANRDGS